MLFITARHYWRGMVRLAALSVLWSVPASGSAQAGSQFAESDLRRALERVKKATFSVSGTVRETVRVSGEPPWTSDRAEPTDRTEPGVTFVWGTSSGSRDFEWWWSRGRWRIRSTERVAPDILRTTDQRSDGRLTYELFTAPDGRGTPQGSVDRSHGSWVTPATFAWTPECIWAADLIQRLTTDSIRVDQARFGERVVIYRGYNERVRAELVFAPDRGYALLSQSYSGSDGFSQFRVTKWQHCEGIHVPIEVNETRHTGATAQTPVWRVLTQSLTNVRVNAVSEQNFRPEWPEGTLISHIPDRKQYKYVGGRLVFVTELGPPRGARRLKTWGLITAVVAVGLLVFAVSVRRRGPKAPSVDRNPTSPAGTFDAGSERT